MPTIDDSTPTVVEGISIQGLGATGTVNPGDIGRSVGARQRAAQQRGIDDSAPAVASRVIGTVELALDAPPTRGRGAEAEPGRFAVEIPDIDADEVGFLLVEQDGLFTWQAPDEDDRGRFTVQASEPPTERGLLGGLAKMGLTALAGKFIESTSERAARALIEERERRRHSVELQAFDAQAHQGGQPVPLDPERLAGDPSLLFLHGTFSSPRGAFGSISPQLMRRLSDRYEDRLWAFSHPTVSVSPRENAEALRELIAAGAPDASPMPVDIIAHSRGGLVARELAQLENSPLDVRQVIFVATPNGGTPLAQSGRVGGLIDVLTNLLGLVPDNGVTDVVEVLMGALDSVWKGFVKAVPGLTAMDPQGEYLEALDSGRPPGALYRALSSNYEPGRDDGTRRRLRDRVTDLYFGGTPNDLVVPTRGVYMGGSAPAFPIDDRHVVDSAQSVDHSGFWTSAPCQEQLEAWLLVDDPATAPSTPVEYTDPGAEVDRALRENDMEGLADALERLAQEARAQVGRDAGSTLVPTPGRRRDSGTRKATGRVVVVPGIAGSRITVDGELIWIDKLGIVFGRLSRLQMDRDVTSELAGVHETYLPLLDYLLHDWQVVPFPYDWRRSVREAGKRLGTSLKELLAESRSPVHIVAHSMGGLVARAAAAADPGSWAELTGRGGRVVMLGTPNRGSHAAVMTLTGDERTVQLLALADLRHDEGEVQAIVAGFPGLYELLPSPMPDSSADRQRDAEILERLYDAETWPTGPEGAIVSAESLSAARKLHTALAKSEREASGEPFVFIAGHGHATPDRLDIRGPGEFRLSSTFRGDGRVAHRLGPLPGMATYYSRARHGELPRDPDVLRAIDALLHHGEVETLAATEPAPRSVDEAHDAPFVPVDRVDALPRGAKGFAHRARTGDATAAIPLVEHATSDLLGTKPTTRPLPVTTVRVAHGSLEVATSPVIVGHYRGMPIDGAEGFLDSKIGGALSDRQLTGVYPETAGEAMLVRALGVPRPPGALVVCLGEFGGLTPTILTRGVRDATLRWALAEAPAAPPSDGPKEVGVSAVLVGTPGRYGLATGSSLVAILEGVIRANMELQAEEIADRVRVTKLDFIEYYEQKAEDAALALRSVEGRLPSDVRAAVELDAAPDLVTLEGGRPGAPRREVEGAWPRILISLDEEHREREQERIAREREAERSGTDDEATDADEAPVERLDLLKFTLLGGAARADERGHPMETEDIEQLVAAAVANRNPRAQINNTLYELLFPNELKQLLDTTDNVHLVLDAHTANYPWEMLAGREPTGDLAPVALRAGFLRQLTSKDGERVRKAPRRPLGLNALVIGDPPTGFARLPGARAEAADVASLLSSGASGGPYEVSDHIYGAGDAAPDDTLWLSLRNALYEREYRIVHIAAHGIVTPGDRTRTGVVIGRDRYLTSLAFKQMPVVPELVFLNCCHLAQTAEDAPPPPRTNYAILAASVATQLMREGVKAVIAAGWAVDDLPAAEFARTFYECMLSGENLGAATRVARQAARDAAPDSNTWGAYQCYGDPGFLLAPRHRSGGAGPAPVSASDLCDQLRAEEARAGVATDERDLAGIASYVRNELLPVVAGPSPRNPGWATADTLAQLGETFKALGCYEEAVVYLRRAVEEEDAGLRVKDIEQLANCEARLAVLRHRGTEGSTGAASRLAGVADTPRQLLSASNRRLSNLLRIGTTHERLALVGGLNKKWATIETRPEARAKRLEAARDAYDQARERAGRAHGRYPYYLNLLTQLSTIVEGPRDELGSRAEELHERASADLAAAIGGGEADFWVRVAVPDALLARLLLSSDDSEAESCSREMQRLYDEAFRLRSTAFERATVIDHIDDVAALSDAHRDRLEPIVGQLRRSRG